MSGIERTQGASVEQYTKLSTLGSADQSIQSIQIISADIRHGLVVMVPFGTDEAKIVAALEEFRTGVRTALHENLEDFIFGNIN